MRLSLRFVLPLVLALAAFAYGVLPLSEDLMARWFIRDLEIRTTLVASAVTEQVQTFEDNNDPIALARYFTRIAQDERTYAIGFCATADGRPVATAQMPTEITCASLDRFTATAARLENTLSGLLVSVRPLPTSRATAGRLVLVHDLSFITRRSEETRRYLFALFIGLGVVVSLLTVVIAQVSWRGWVQGTRALLRGEGLFRPSGHPEFSPIASDLRELIRDLESERRPKDTERRLWNADTLRSLLNDNMRGHEVIVVSNREPYIHDRVDGRVIVRRPASGMVTALEPIMRTCSGTWIAHGSGSADREVVDRHNRIPVPPEAPAYKLRRVWLNEAEEAGFYYGFANEGLWPLCHIAHVRPVFRSTDWDQYVRVNQRYANAVVEEATSRDPIVLVQDYHLALAPRMIREKLPDATIITFWHIPWPNPEAFGICPWREELLDGLLGSSILGFHTQFHCNNFVDTVDRLLEARVDRETFTVSYRGQLTAVNRYPISIEWPPPPALIKAGPDVCHERVTTRHGLPSNQVLGIGVDRLDYTKGIDERFRAVERLLELHPEWQGRFTFIQIAAPSRTPIDEYRHYGERVVAMAHRINARFAAAGAPAIVLDVTHREPPEVYEHYRAAQLCCVSSLHDGMNLVAKEFVASRDDERGVLVLSQFTGAARELPEALIVNPYDIDQCAQALFDALTMPEEQQRMRMRLMRGLVRDFNVYRWAGHMLIDAAGLRAQTRLRQRTPHRIDG